MKDPPSDSEMNQDSDSELTDAQKAHRAKVLSYNTTDSEFASVLEYFEDPVYEKDDVSLFSLSFVFLCVHSYHLD